MKESAEAFWQRVKALLTQKNLTQKNLADMSEIDYSNLKQQIFHKRSPSALEAVRIAKSLETSVEYLVVGEDQQIKIITDKEALEALHEIKKITDKYQKRSGSPARGKGTGKRSSDILKKDDSKKAASEVS